MANEELMNMISGRVLAALAPRVSLPAPGATPPLVPTGNPSMIPGLGLPGNLPLPGPEMEDTRPSFIDALPILVAKARGQAAGMTPPIAPAEPSGPQFAGGIKGLFQRLLANAPDALQVGLSSDPGAAMRIIAENKQLQANRREDIARQAQMERDRNRQELERTLLSAGINADVQSRRDEADLKAERIKADAKKAETEQTRALKVQDNITQRVRALGDKGIDPMYGQVFAEAEEGLREWTPELRAAYKNALGAESAEKLKKADTENKKAIATQANSFMDDSGGKITRSQAVKFAAYELTGSPLSPSEQKAYDNFRKAKLTGGGGSGGDSDGERGTVLKNPSKFLNSFENLKASIYALENAGDLDGARMVRRKLADFTRKAPLSIEVGYDQFGNPYAKPRGGGQATAPPAQANAQPTAQPAGPQYSERVKAYAQRFGMSPEQAKKELGE